MTCNNFVWLILGFVYDSYQVMMNSILGVCFAQNPSIWVAFTLLVPMLMCTILLASELASVLHISMKILTLSKIKFKSQLLKFFPMNAFLRYSDGCPAARSVAHVPVYLSSGSILSAVYAKLKSASPIKLLRSLLPLSLK